MAYQTLRNTTKVLGPFLRLRTPPSSLQDDGSATRSIIHLRCGLGCELKSEFRTGSVRLLFSIYTLDITATWSTYLFELPWEEEELIVACWSCVIIKVVYERRTSGCIYTSQGGAWTAACGGLDYSSPVHREITGIMLLTHLLVMDYCWRISRESAHQRGVSPKVWTTGVTKCKSSPATRWCLKTQKNLETFSGQHTSPTWHECDQNGEGNAR